MIRVLVSDTDQNKVIMFADFSCPQCNEAEGLTHLDDKDNKRGISIMCRACNTAFTVTTVRLIHDDPIRLIPEGLRK